MSAPRRVYASTSALYLSSTEFADGGYFTPSFATTRIHKLNAFEGVGAAEYQATGLFIGSVRDELSLDEGPDGSRRGARGGGRVHDGAAI